MKKKVFIFLSVIFAAFMLASCGKKTYTVTFDVAGGAPEVAAQKIKKGGLVNEPNDPAKEGHDFTGWYLGEDKWVFETDTVTKKITLVAGWEVVEDEPEMVNVVFNTLGGTPVPAAQVIEKGEKAVKPETDPTRDGYLFLGWVVGGEDYDFDAPVEADLTILASWEEIIPPTEYTVTFLPDGGTPAPDTSVTVIEGEKVPEPAAMQKDKHEFLGWFVGDVLYDFDQPVTGNLLLSARWEEILEEYVVEFDAGYEGADAIEDAQVIEYEKVDEPEVGRLGYRLMGWYDGETKWDFNLPVTKDMTLVARWEEEFVVEFDLNYEGAELISPMLVLKGEKVDEPTFAPREFHALIGWFLDGELFDFDTPIEEAIELVAQWEELETYEITYENTSPEMFVYGTKEDMIEGFLTDFHTYLKSSFLLSDFMHGVGKTSGYDGLWYESLDSLWGGPRPETYNNQFFASHEDYMDKWLPFLDMIHEFVLIVNPDQYFFGAGVWTGKIRIHQWIIGKRPNGSEGPEHMEMMPDPLIQNTPVTMHLGLDDIELLVPYRIDADFLGWYDNAEFEGEPITKIDAGTKEDVTVYAKWAELAKYDITFDIGYAEGVSPEAQEVIDGFLVVKPADPARRPGHKFLGWFEEDAETPFNFAVAPTKDVALEARWEEIEEVKITIDADVDGVEEVVHWLEKGSTLDKPADPEKDGHRFLGWFIGEDEVNFEEAFEVDSVIVAKWEELEGYTITYHLGGGEFAKGYETREEMIVDFLTDWYNFLDIADTVTLNEFMHGTDKTEGFQGRYKDIASTESESYFYELYLVVDNVANKDIAPETGKFINQVEYNRWVPLLDLIDEYVGAINPDQVGQFWSSQFVGIRRIEQFVRATGNAGKEYFEMIPAAYALPTYSYNEDTPTFDLPLAVRDGFDFGGWYLVPNPTEEDFRIDDIEKGNKEDYVLYANWGVTLERYKVEYDLGYDDLKLDDLYVLEGDKVVELEPVRPTYAFLGWFLNDELFDFDTIIDEDIVLVAQWEKLDEVVVEFDLNYDGAPAMDDVSIGTGEKVNKPADPVREGFTFMGWNLVDEAYDFDAAVTEDITLVAQWREIILVEFELNDGFLPGEALMEFYGKNKFVATRYHLQDDYFAGDHLSLSKYSRGWWSAIGIAETEYPGVYKVVGKGDGGSQYSHPDADLYFRAHDGLKAVEGGTAIYNAFISLYNKIAVDELIYVGQLPEKSAVGVAIDVAYLGAPDLDANPMFDFYDLEGLINPVREGFEFVSWHLEEDLSDDAYVFPEELDAAIKLYAKWVEKVYFEVSFDVDGIDAQQVEIGHKADKPADPTKEGFTFLGWYVGEELYDFDEPVTANVELVAKWEALDVFEVTFKEDETDETPLVVDVFDGNKVAKPKDPAERPGFLFEGWFLGEEAFDFDTVITEDVVLVGKWREAEKVTISFDLNYEGSVAMDDVKIEKGTKFTKPADPVREDYVFLGWVVGEEAFDFDEILNEDVTLKATWELTFEASVKVIYDLGEYAYYGVTREDVMNEFLDDYRDFYNEHVPANVEKMDALLPGAEGYDASTSIAARLDVGAANLVAIFGNEDFYNKWIWIVEYMRDQRSDKDDFNALINKTATASSSAVKYELTAFVGASHRNSWPASTDYTDPVVANSFWGLSPYNIAAFAFDKVDGLLKKEDFTIWVDGFVFAGFVDANDDPVTQLPESIEEDLLLFAVWEEIPGPITIAEAIAADEGTDVIIVGVVTGFTSYNASFSNYDKVWLEDETGAITIYRGTFPENLAIGDKYEIAGKTAVFSGLIQIAQGSELTLIDSDNDLNLPTEVTEFSDLDESLMAKRVDLEAIVVSVNASGQNLVVEFDGKLLTLRSNSNSASDSINAHLLTAIAGQTVMIKGIHVDWHNGAQLLPTSVDQVEFLPLTEAQKVDLAIAELKALYEDEKFDMEVTIALLGQSEHEVLITWVLDPVDAIEDGKWMVVTEDTAVTLTATLTLGEIEEELVLNVTVKFVDSEAADPVEVLHWDFGSIAKTGYDTESVTWENSDGTEITAAKDRAQLNVSTSGPHADKGVFLILAPVKGKENSFFELDFSDLEGMNTVTLEVSTWAAAAANNIKNDPSKFNLVLEIKDGDDWNQAGLYDLQENVSSDEYKLVTFDDLVAGVYRIRIDHEGLTKSSNTNYAVTIDNIKVYK